MPIGWTAYRRDVFLKQLFDEKLGGDSYMEDIDLPYRVSRDYKLLYQPKATLEHFTKTHTNIDSRFLRRIIIRNHIYLFRKNIPKNLPHLYGFFMSILGLLLYNSIVAKDIRACLDLIEGIIHPISVTD